jgi:hypothetical protein
LELVDADDAGSSMSNTIYILITSPLLLLGAEL